MPPVSPSGVLPPSRPPTQTDIAQPRTPSHGLPGAVHSLAVSVGAVDGGDVNGDARETSNGAFYEETSQALGPSSLVRMVRPM